MMRWGCAFCYLQEMLRASSRPVDVRESAYACLVSRFAWEVLRTTCPSCGTLWLAPARGVPPAQSGRPHRRITNHNDSVNYCVSQRPGAAQRRPTSTASTAGSCSTASATTTSASTLGSLHERERPRRSRALQRTSLRGGSGRVVVDDGAVEVVELRRSLSWAWSASWGTLRRARTSRSCPSRGRPSRRATAYAASDLSSRARGASRVAVLCRSSAHAFGRAGRRDSPSEHGPELRRSCWQHHAIVADIAREQTCAGRPPICRGSSRERGAWRSVRPGRHERRPPFLVEWSARGGVDPSSVEERRLRLGL